MSESHAESKDLIRHFLIIKTAEKRQRACAYMSLEALGSSEGRTAHSQGHEICEP